MARFHHPPLRLALALPVLACLICRRFDRHYKSDDVYRL